MRLTSIVLLTVIFAVGCSQSSPVRPDSSTTDSTAIVIPDPGAGGGRPLTATLRVEEEVPACNEPAPPARGTATISLNVGLGQVCWVIDVQNADPPFTGAHIHEAPPGVAGPIVVPFTTPNTSGHTEGCTSVDRELVKDILQNPEEYYVNVHNRTCPGGVARGQLSK
jgi:hypothetical protein